MVLKPPEEGKRPFVVIQCPVVFSLIEIFIALFPEFLVGHEARAALKPSDLLVVLPVVKQRVLQVNRVLVKQLPADSCRLVPLTNAEIQLVGREVVLELRNEGLIVAFGRQT